MVYESFQIVALHDMGTIQILFVEVSCGCHVDRTDGSVLLLYACKYSTVGRVCFFLGILGFS